jgi:hypothetical protein
VTLAVCIRCRTPKFGAFVPCRRCGYAPQTEEEQNVCIACSDHVLSVEQLMEIAGVSSEQFWDAIFNKPRLN